MEETSPVNVAGHRYIRRRVPLLSATEPCVRRRMPVSNTQQRVSDHVPLCHQLATLEAIVREGADIHLRMAVQQQLRHHQPDGRRLHEAVPGEATGAPEALYVTHRPQ